MSFVCADLVIESLIRDGLANITKNPTIIDSVFGSLLANYNMRKYGAKELERLRTFITEKQIKVVHSFGEIDTRIPCFSIQLGNDVEAKREARLGDFDGELIEKFSEDSEEFQETILVANKTPISYDATSGRLSFDLSVDLSGVSKNKKYVNADGEFIIAGPVLNTVTERSVFLEKGLDIDLTKPGNILSQLDYTQTEIHGVHSDVSILIGVHSKDALTTKYMYILLKYFLLSRKPDLIKRCFITSSFQGSDFTRNMEIKGDMVYTRFMTVTGKTEDSWRGDEVELFDELEVQIAVGADDATAEDLGLEDSSVTVSTNPKLKC